MTNTMMIWRPSCKQTLNAYDLYTKAKIKSKLILYLSIILKLSVVNPKSLFEMFRVDDREVTAPNLCKEPLEQSKQGVIERALCLVVFQHKLDKRHRAHQTLQSRIHKAGVTQIVQTTPSSHCCTIYKIFNFAFKVFNGNNILSVILRSINATISIMEKSKGHNSIKRPPSGL